jgi:hypothetical protein
VLWNLVADVQGPTAAGPKKQARCRHRFCLPDLSAAGVCAFKAIKLFSELCTVFLHCFHPQLGSPLAALQALAAAGAYSRVKDEAWTRISSTDPGTRVEGWRLLVPAAIASDDQRIFGSLLRVSDHSCWLSYTAHLAAIPQHCKCRNACMCAVPCGSLKLQISTISWHHTLHSHSARGFATI